MSQITNLGAANGGGGTNTFQTDSGIATPAAGVITFNAISQAGSTVLFSGSGSTVRLNVTNANNTTIMGKQAGNVASTATNSTGFGYQVLATNASGGPNDAYGYASLNKLTLGTLNAAFGFQSAGNITTGSNNSAFGNNALGSATGAASNNSAFGQFALHDVLTGSNNIAIGAESASNYVGAESSNLIIQSAQTSVPGESNVMRIGGGTGVSDGQQNKCFISGINGVTASNAVMVTINSSTDQLGVQAIPQGANTWTVITGASQAIAVNNGYISNRAGLITYSLPATSAIGDIFEITNINTALGWTISQAAGQSIRVGNVVSTVGVGGSVSSLALGDSIRCVCTVANLNWVAVSSMGNLTIV